MAPYDPAVSWLDHAFVALAVLVAPLYSWWGYGKLERDLDRGVRGARMREYAETIALLWLLGLGAVAIWLGQGRPPEAIGLALPGGWGVVPALALSGGLVWFLSAQLARVRKMPTRPTAGVEGIESVRALLPASRRELRTFVAAALSAGLFEEFVYRGYLIAYLATWMPVWAAAAVSSLAFSWGHVYQGLSGLPRIFLLALALAGLYLWTGSLLLPVALHAFVDINSTLTARAVLAKPRAESPPGAAAG